ncbi:MAG: replication initiation protein, partial [Clostridia bacterium]|nr:replication initiation protein [Clostridia bacterium]
SKAFDDIGRLVITIDEGDRLIKSHWFNEMVYDKKTDTFTVSFGKNITPYLFQLQRLYTQYSLETVLAMKSKYAIRLYELLLSYRNMRIKQVYSIDELKELLDCNTYKTFQHLQSRVLIPAIEDINSLTDIKVRYDTLKEGRRIVAIEFTVSYNADTHADNFLRRHMLLGGREKP